MTIADSTAAVLQPETDFKQADLYAIAAAFSSFTLKFCTFSTSEILISSRQAQLSSVERVTTEHSFIFAEKLRATSEKELRRSERGSFREWSHLFSISVEQLLSVVSIGCISFAKDGFPVMLQFDSALFRWTKWF